jgi:hypothetical protein
MSLAMTRESTRATLAAPARPTVTGLLQRKCDCAGCACDAGEWTNPDEESLPGALQRKVQLGASDDSMEREADRVAEQVLTAPVRMGYARAPVKVQRFGGSTGSSASTAPESVERALAESGSAMEPALCRDMEQRFGYDFGQVRVHAGTTARQSAREINAQAYTVGRHIVFAEGRFTPATGAGRRLIAHELTHVLQQSAPSAGPSAHPDGPSAVARPSLRAPGHRGPLLQRHKDDLVAYTGGQSGQVVVIEAGKWIASANAVSGHPGHGENEPGVGPIPSGRYRMYPGRTRATVAKSQAGVCGANAISSGYQAITSTDARPCSGAHYCNVPCPTAADPARKCFTPKDCWGPHRIKINGSKAVVTPSGKRKVRDGFYLHGGNPADAVSSGCVKSLDDTVFAPIRKLKGVKGMVPFCVGASCASAVNKAVVSTVSDALNSVLDDAKEMMP